MKAIRYALDVITLISAILCLYAIISISMDIMVENEIFGKILYYNLFACPILTIITCASIINREGDKNNG